MPLDDFLRYFAKEGIGSCEKRRKDGDYTPKYKRPIIGKLGIGMLAIGQLCHSFKIESHYRDENGEEHAYEAEIVLEDDFPFPDKEEAIRDAARKTKKIDVGEWRLNDSIGYDPAKEGFRVYSSDVRPTFRQEMRSSVREEMKDSERTKMSFSLAKLHREFYDGTKSVRDHKAYLETIWETSILCPVPYAGQGDECPVRFDSFPARERRTSRFKQAADVIRAYQKELLSRRFRVVFDGIEIRRHIRLPTTEDAMPRLYPLNFQDTVFGSPLKFSGYVFAQAAKAVRPLELNGVQIRLRGVGIGGYDATFLRYYKQIETIRSRWVSGEVFVHDGLEAALNIDRDSFNEHDEHFKKLRDELHDTLDRVFGNIKALSRVRSEKKRDRREILVRRNLAAFIDKQSKGVLNLVQREMGADDPIVRIDDKAGQIVLNTAARPVRRKKPDMLIRAVELAYHVSEKSGRTKAERHQIFLKLITDILSELA
ncbi:MAG: hypothetical protein KAX19_08415, partial [Candidatus Brocadiae bacterium]|nr:hypothetical protein [Candidatus Brocadiia bacterium]